MRKLWIWGAAGFVTMTIAVGAPPAKAAILMGAFTAGNGTLSNPYIINSAYQLQQLAMLVNANEQDPLTGALYANESYELGSNIDLTNVGNWIPIGESVSFSGTFNGAGHKIVGLTIASAPSGGNSGLFGMVSGGTIENVGLEETSISAGLNAGALAGTITGYTYITDSYSSGTVSTSGQVSSTGGLVGDASGTLTLRNAYTTGSVSASGPQASIGGVIGVSDGSISLTNIYSSSTVSSTGGSSDVGGLIGRGTAQVSSSFYLQGDGGSYGTAEPLTALQNQATFSGWDFTYVWALGANTTPSLLAFKNPPTLPLLMPVVFEASSYSVPLGGMPNTGTSGSSSSSSDASSNTGGSPSSSDSSTTSGSDPASPVPFSWGVINGSLPPGLSFNSDGTLSGFAGSSGFYNATLELGNGEEVIAVAPVNFDVLFGAAPPLTITTGLLPDANVDVPYSFQLTACFGDAPYTWSILSGTLPTGLSLSPSGEITGTPTGPDGTSPLILQVTDSNNTQVQDSFSITVDGSGVPQISTTPLPVGKMGQAYQTQLSVTGGAAPYQWLQLSGALPAGLTLQADGTISGTPTASGSYSITVQVMGANGVIDIEPFTLRIRKN